MAKVAYADPPYPGCAHLYKKEDSYGGEVDHKELIERLERDYDGWALSTSSPALAQLLPLCPDGIRIAAWTKPFCIFKPNVNPAYTWEPVLFKPPRRRGRKEPTIRDHVAVNITLKKGLVGAKPPEFCLWLFDLLQMEEGDELADLFPGTGVVSRQWEIWKARKCDLFGSAK